MATLTKNASVEKEVKKFIERLSKRNPNETEFIQAVEEVVESILPFIKNHKKYSDPFILDRLCEPERVIMFNIPWLDDKGNYRLNRGYRVQMNSAIGPYKGGLRFHPSVNLSILKFLAFEQVFKNSLTTLPLGGAKGGADFDPKGKTDNEIMKFCQSYMTEMYRYIGADVDIPAGDIGVNEKEIGYMFGQYKRLKTQFNGVITGKGLSFGGSPLRPEATGYGTVYFAREMLKKQGEKLDGKTAVISGAGNVALFAAEKLIEHNVKVLAVSDSGGFMFIKDGLTQDVLEKLMEFKFEKRGRLKKFAEEHDYDFYKGEKPWSVKCDMAFPCATQNEIYRKEAQKLVDNGCMLVSEGANMPSTKEAIDVFKKNKILYGPGKAANAGGVAISGLEMVQNSNHRPWTREEVNDELRNIMRDIHDECTEYGNDGNGYVDYVKGANIAGFIKVADAMIAQGLV